MPKKCQQTLHERFQRLVNVDEWLPRFVLFIVVSVSLRQASMGALVGL